MFLLVLCSALPGACTERGDVPRPTVGSERSAAPRATTPTKDSPTPDRKEIEADMVLDGGTLIDGTGGPPITDAALALEGGRIVAVGKADELPVASGARVVNVRGKTVLPGFVDAHAHSDSLTAEQTKSWTRAGVTTVRDLGGPLELMTDRRRRFDKSTDPQLPRLLIAGPMVTVPGGHPIPIYGPDYPVLTVQGSADARARVNGLLDAGVDHVKIAVSGRADTGWPELSDEEIRAITDAAHARGARVSAHVDTAAGLRRAVENGVDDAAHAPRDRIPDDLISLMVERGVVLVPTIDVYENLSEEGGYAAGWRATTLPIMYDNLRRFARAGGVLALGDDYGNPGVELGMPTDEVEHWVAAGITPMRVIVTATRGGAIACGLEDEIGTLERGKAADVLVVDGDPLADVRALERVALVVRDGEVAFQR